MNILEIDSLVHSFRRQKVLTDIYLKCQTGEVIGILGKNGSGKSTLLKSIFGILKADSISMHINGLYIEDQQKQARIVALPQYNFLPRDISVGKCINLYLEDQQQTRELRNHIRIQPVLNQRIHNLSRGEQRYLEVLLILALDADFTLLDEPFTELEPIYKAKIKEMIMGQLKQKCFIITDHNYRNIIDLSSRLCLLKGGELFEISDKNQLITMGYLPQESNPGSEAETRTIR